MRATRAYPCTLKFEYIIIQKKKKLKNSVSAPTRCSQKKTPKFKKKKISRRRIRQRVCVYTSLLVCVCVCVSINCSRTGSTWGYFLIVANIISTIRDSTLCKNGRTISSEDDLFTATPV